MKMIDLFDNNGLLKSKYNTGLVTRIDARKIKEEIEDIDNYQEYFHNIQGSLSFLSTEITKKNKNGCIIYFDYIENHPEIIFHMIQRKINVNGEFKQFFKYYQSLPDKYKLRLEIEML